MKLDIHSRKVSDRTLQLTSQVLTKNSGVEVLTFELFPPEAIPFMNQEKFRTTFLKSKINWVWYEFTGRTAIHAGFAKE